MTRGYRTTCFKESRHLVLQGAVHFLGEEWGLPGRSEKQGEGGYECP